MVVPDDFLFKLLLFLDTSPVRVFHTLTLLPHKTFRIFLLQDSLGLDKSLSFINQRTVVSSIANVRLVTTGPATRTISAVEVRHRVLSLAKSLCASHAGAGLRLLASLLSLVTSAALSTRGGCTTESKVVRSVVQSASLEQLDLLELLVGEILVTLGSHVN